MGTRIEGVGINESNTDTSSPMHLYSRRMDYFPPNPIPTPVIPQRLQPYMPFIDPLTVVVDLVDLGLRGAYQAHEIHRGSQCPVFVKMGPEYVNPWSGAREQGRWIL